MKVYLNALGLITPLGRDKREVAGNLFKGSRSGLIERADLLPERTVRHLVQRFRADGSDLSAGYYHGGRPCSEEPPPLI